MRSRERKIIMAFDYSHIGERIRYYRTKAGMSQSELASALYISSSHYISRLEKRILSKLRGEMERQMKM